MAQTISLEMGAPITLSREAQAPVGLHHLSEMANVLEHFKFDELKGSTMMRKEPIGVAGLITPWNWPINQIVCKTAPALAAGCSIVLKPSEMAPLSAYLLAQILDEAGVPPGVFNLVNGNGTMGAAIASHPDVDMVSFTGSTRVGVAVAVAAAPDVKRVTQELGGKSAHIILDDADLESSVIEGVSACFRNTGQSCNAPTRMLVPRCLIDTAAAIARQVAESVKVGDPFAECTRMGPLATKAGFEKVQRLMSKAIDEGATLIAGGPGRPHVYSKTRAAGFGPEVKRRIMLGTYALSSGYYDAYYLKALKVRRLIKQDYDKAFEKVDVIATPTAPNPAFRFGEKTGDPLSMYLEDVFTVSINITGLPGLSVPCGMSKSELPIGLQLIGKAFDEATLLRTAYAYEQATPWHKEKPSLRED